MTPAPTAAAERLVSLPGFRWMPGMVDVEGRRFVGVEECAESMADTAVWLVDVAEGDEDRVPALPDLTDPATLGCVLAMVREAWRYHVCPLWCVSNTGLTIFEAHLDGLEAYAEGRTEAECLVNALAAAVGAQ